MATTKLQNTFLSTYRDDFRDSDNYHRILFNSGRALQARELTQMQTIIQTELERFARYIFKDGALLTSSMGSFNSGLSSVQYVKLNTTTYPFPTTPANLVGTEIQNDLASPVKARVIEAIAATGGDPATLIIKYLTSGNNDNIDATTPRLFQAGELLTTDEGTLEVAATNPTGQGSFITVPANQFFAAGHFVFTTKQSLVIEKYNSTPTVNIGYIVNEEIVTTADDLALYDNTGSTPNLTSPGADRYRIRLTLSKESDAAATDTFIPLIKVKNGVVQVVQNKDNVLSEIGSTISARTADVNGDFVVNDGTSFKMSITNADSDGALYINMGTGTAFVKGNRIAKVVPENNIVFPKPRTLASDTITITGDNTVADYGNYFIADSMYGMVSKLTMLKDDAVSSSSINMYNGTNIGGTQIGTAKLRNIDAVSSEYKLHIFDLEMDSNGTGTRYNLSDTKSVGTDSANYANIKLYNSKATLYDTNRNSLLFRMPHSRPQNVSSIVMNVAETFTGTTSSNSVTINTSDAADEFTDLDQWILAYDSGGEVVTGIDGIVTAGGAGSNTVTIGSLTDGKDVHLLAYVNVTGQVKAKTKISTTESVSLTNGKFQLSKADVYEVTSITDNTTGEIITTNFDIDYGQRPNYYDVLRGTLKPNQSAPAGTITVAYDYFQHGAGDFFAINSYDLNSVAYKDLPGVYNRNTNTVKTIGNMLDFRPVINNAGTGFTGTGAVIERIPRSSDLITSTNRYWLPRIDIVYLNKDGIFGRAEGTPGFNPREPEIPDGAIALHYIILNPYVFDKNDLINVRIPNKGYQMKDIRRLEDRVASLEEIASLTVSELQLTNTAVLDDQGLTREKLGITGDTFKDHSLSDVKGNHSDYSASLDLTYGVLRPIEVKRQVPLWYDSDASTNTIRKADMIMPKYTEEVMINQNVASQSEDVNQFELTRYVGAANVDPEADTWIVRRTLVNGREEIVVKGGDYSTYDTFVEYGRQET